MKGAGQAVVTGAARGIGAVIAGRLLDDGHDLLLVDLSPGVTATATALGDDVRSLVADVSAPGGADAVAAAVRERRSPLRVLVNNAGITRDGRATDLAEDDFQRVVEVNLVAAMRVTLALEELFGSGSSVVTMSSRAALGNFGQANYVASKAGVQGFTRALAQRWAPRGVRVNAVAPGLIETPMTAAMPEQVLTKLVERIPLGRIGRAQDVASAVAFLASPESAYVTGQTLLVCGGRSVAA